VNSERKVGSIGGIFWGAGKEIETSMGSDFRIEGGGCFANSGVSEGGEQWPRERLYKGWLLAVTKLEEKKNSAPKFKNQTQKGIGDLRSRITKIFSKPRKTPDRGKGAFGGGV